MQVSSISGFASYFFKFYYHLASSVNLKDRYDNQKQTVVISLQAMHCKESYN